MHTANHIFFKMAAIKMAECRHFAKSINQYLSNGLISRHEV